ncbi:hypothetical protein BDZ94DRAFT_1261533 [Collybia nuda]|uniref:Transmembrane protein n=1 Tax=Collybia nuda TaxID=64659 RepID=A0A9P6CDX2_9AGAR|nr:hypothetical protein BDZ94DRAFT_1261533 [Collybia nuda]
MPSFNITIEDSSPTIFYSQGWRAGHSSDDTLISSYSQSAFSVTNIKGAFLSFSFNGTAIGIFGGRRKNHGMYQVKLDDTLQPPSNGREADPGTLQVPLFSVDSLTQSLHNVTLTNLDDAYLDIDFITWRTMIGDKADDKFYINTFQDTNPSFTYLPTEADWAVVPRNIGSFMGGSGHATTNPRASLVYNFEGDGVSLYGPIGPDGSSYAVSVDDGLMRTFTANKEYYVPQSLLFHASSLGPGSHNLTLTYQENTQQQTFAIDYAAVYATTTLPHSTKTTSISKEAGAGSTGQQSTIGRPESQHIRLIIGLAVAVAILLITSGVLFTLFWRQRRMQGRWGRLTSETGTRAIPTIHTSHRLSDAESNSNRNRYRFQKSLATEAGSSRTHLTSNSGFTSTVRTPPHIGNPPEYTPNI